MPDPAIADTPAPPPEVPAAAPGPHPRLTAAAEVLLCSGLPTQLLVLALLRAAGWASPASDVQPLLVLLLADTVLVIALMVLLLAARGERPADLWLGRRPVTGEVLAGIWLTPLVFLMVVVLLNALRLWAPWLHNVPDNPLEQLAGTSPGDAALFALVAIVAGGVREELQRAFLLHRFEQHLGGTVVGVVVVSVGFGLGHFVQGWDAVVTTGALGALWAIVYVRRRSVVAPMVSHAGFNALEVLRVVVS